jgi:hypothetical protein
MKEYPKQYPKLNRTLAHVNLSFLINTNMQEYFEEYMFGGLLCGM